ncbi:glutathione peroxidase [Ascobolus immersus RN42]|uniref:Glutathione peroxidase n=1 Tax=Ascobolus immersus RN42 TaxID=1160509 RepID=A0A3N4IU34_ASCIM|nr:glutathione peroxidase [Ascobolus immersus RN42]
MSASVPQSFYDLVAKDAKGQDFKFSDLKGKPVLIVNVASKCGFTGQYAGLQQLHEKYGSKGLQILGFPCNQFGGQEPGEDSDIQSFCSLNYGVSFPVLGKVEVNGDNASPVWEFLKNKKSGLLGLKRIKWNFEKFLVSKDGEVVERWASTSTPASLESAIEKELAKLNKSEL